MNPKNFFAELKRRNVYKVAVAYAVIAWLLLQGASIVFPSFEAPAWAMKVLIAALAVGLPIAVVLAWAFEITPEGIVRADEVEPSRSVTRQTGRKLAALIAVAAILAAGLFVFQKSKRGGASETESPSLKALPAANDKSIAVLPFSDLSAARDQQFFGDGLAEELLNVLVQIDGLSVASRTSSFAFKGKNLPLPEIARTLGVAHIVEGSVRRAGDRFRVTAQLIDVATDRHLWSQTFDREVTDIFAIQDEIARSIADALKVRLGRAAGSVAGTDNVAAYELYLLGLYHWNQRTEEGLRKALEIFRQATELDPTFARAFAGLSLTYAVLPSYAQFDFDLAQREAEIAARKAVELDPKSAEALTALGQTFELTGELRRSVEAYDRALAINPRFVTARHWKGITLTVMGRPTEGETELRTARALDPASLALQSYLGLNLGYQRRFPEALAETLDVLKRAPEYRNSLFQAFTFAALMDRPREHLALLERYFRGIGESPSLAATIVDGIESPERRPAAIAALEAIAPRHLVAGRQSQMAELFGLLKAEEQTLKLIDGDRESPVYPHWPVYDFLRGNPRYEAMLAESKRRAQGAETALEETARP